MVSPAFATSIVVLGDLEGNGQKFDQFVQTSGAFEKDGFTMRPGYRFVFMGDSVDRGPSSMRILDTLIALKKQYPSQVVLIIGNRDANKLAFRWMFQGDGEDPTRMKTFLRAVNAPDAFEYRRQELAANGLADDDMAVFESLKGDLAPDGRMTQYLAHAQVAYIDEDSGGIFVHGGISDKGLGYVPGHFSPITDVRQWVKTLNDWAQSRPRELFAYQRPQPQSVIYQRSLDLTNNPQLPPDFVVRSLQSQGIHYLAVGHTPVGDLPVVLSAKDFRMVMTDNSYSRAGTSSWTRIEDSQIKFGGQMIDIKFDSHLPILGDSAIGSLSYDGWRRVGNLESECLEWQIQGRHRAVYRLDATACEQRPLKKSWFQQFLGI